MGAPYMRLSVVMDFIKHPEAFLKRDTAEIAGAGPDTRFIIPNNARENRRLGKKENWANLWGTEEGKICLMVCPGPSLTESLPELAELAKDRDTYFTMGFNRSLRAMDLDYFMCLDRRAQADWITRPTGDCKLLTAPTAAPKIAAKFQHRWWGDTFLYGVDEGLTPIRTSMAITQCEAMHAAYKLGAREIWLYGSDFSISGGVHKQGPDTTFRLEKYYFDMPFTLGFKAHRTAFPDQYPVAGIHNRLVFVNYELWAYSVYAFTMCMMLEQSGGIVVRNRSRAGILDWRIDENPVPVVLYPGTLCQHSAAAC